MFNIIELNNTSRLITKEIWRQNFQYLQRNTLCNKNLKKNHLKTVQQNLNQFLKLTFRFFTNRLSTLIMRILRVNTFIKILTFIYLFLYKKAHLIGIKLSRISFFFSKEQYHVTYRSYSEKNLY